MIDFETMFFTLLVFSGANFLMSVLCMAVVLKRIGEIPRDTGKQTSTWNTMEGCEVYIVEKDDDGEVEV